jgi:hypothetical protein
MLTDAGGALEKLCAAVGYRYTNGTTNSSAAANYTVVAKISDLATSSKHNSTDKFALGVGLGVGFPLMAAIGALAGILLFRTRQRRIYGPGVFSYEPHMATQQTTVPQEMDAHTKLQELETRPEELESRYEELESRPEELGSRHEELESRHEEQEHRTEELGPLNNWNHQL